MVPPVRVELHVERLHARTAAPRAVQRVRRRLRRPRDPEDADDERDPNGDPERGHDRARASHARLSNAGTRSAPAASSSSSWLSASIRARRPREVVSPAETQAALEWQALTAPMGVFADPQAMIASRIPDPIWDDEVEGAAPATKSAAIAPHGAAATVSAKEQTDPAHVASITPMPAMPAPRKKVDVMAEIDAYLWDVYQRVPVKKDSSGDFTWKDQAAAKRMGLSLEAYVIGGMDPDFREDLYHAGKAMDAAGLQWSMLSAFRDDYRQKIASGFNSARFAGSR